MYEPKEVNCVMNVKPQFVCGDNSLNYRNRIPKSAFFVRFSLKKFINSSLAGNLKQLYR